MFFYVNGPTCNVLLSLDELEAAVLLTQQYAPQWDPDYAKRVQYLEVVRDTLQTGGKIHLIVTANRNDDTLTGFRGTLSDLPESYRTRATRALTSVAARFSAKLEVQNVDCIGE